MVDSSLKLLYHRFPTISLVFGALEIVTDIIKQKCRQQFLLRLAYVAYNGKTLLFEHNK